MKPVTILLFIAALALGAAEPVKLTDAEKLKIRETQLAISTARGQMAAAEAQYREADAAVRQMEEWLAGHVDELRRQYKCPDCVLNLSDLSLRKDGKPAETPPAK